MPPRSGIEFDSEIAPVFVKMMQTSEHQVAELTDESQPPVLGGTGIIQ